MWVDNVKPDEEETDMMDDRDGAATAETVLRAVAEVLGTSPGPRATDRRLGELGIDSMGALRLQRLLKSRGVVVDLIDLHGDATPNTVATAAESGSLGQSTPGSDSARDDAVAKLALEPWDAFRLHPGSALTPVQQAYWAGRGGDFTLGGVASWWFTEYEIQTGSWGGDPMDVVARLETAWRRVVAAHPMLRSVVDRDGRRRLAVHDVRDLTIDRVDLRDGGKEESELGDLRRERSHRVPDPAQWPLFEVTAVILPDGVLRLMVGIDVLVIDFESWTILMRQWGELFAEPRRDPASAPGFGEVIARRATDPEHRRLVARDARWWAGRDLHPSPALPVDADAVANEFTRERAHLDAAMVEGLRRQCAARGIGLSAAVAAAYALVLNRLRVDDGPFSVNVTLNDRPADASGIVGDFTSTGILDVADGVDRMSFAEFAEALGRELWDVMDHRRAPAVLERRRRGGVPGEDTVVFTSAIGGPRPPSEGVFANRVGGVSQTPQVLIDHITWEEGDSIELVWDHRVGEWPEGFWALFVEAECRVLAGLAAGNGWDEPGIMWDPAGELPDEAPDPGDRPLLHHPWLVAAQEHPDRLAVTAAGESISHGALHGRAERIASGLLREGLRPRDPVMIGYPKGVEQVAATLGVLLAGGAYVPVDPAWPERRLRSIRERTGARIMLRPQTAEAAPTGVREFDVTALVGGELPRSDEADPSDLAYVIFTSGSTGDPKGVAIEHRQARATIDDINRRFQIGPDDVVLGVAALSFDLSVHDIFGTMGAGGSVVLPDPRRLKDPQHWLDLMRAHGVTVWNSAPPMLEMLVEYAEYAPEATEALSHLRLVMLSGDWIPVTLPDRLRSIAPNAEVHSLGGATEAAIWSITHPVGEVDVTAPSIPYGRGISGQWFHILDEDGLPCRVNQPGELWIGGAGVARGYIGDPERTAERFVVHPLLGQRLYRTGDLGKWRYDGEIDFLGRIDRQVKVGGNRIELGEVEAALLRLPAVSSAIAQAVPGPDGRPRLVAHIVLADGERVDPGSVEAREWSNRLTEALGSEVPDSMIPSRFSFRDAMPTTDNGKIDVKALENPFAAGGAALHGPAPAAAATEEAPAWASGATVPGDAAGTGVASGGSDGSRPEMPAAPGSIPDGLPVWSAILSGFASGPPWPGQSPAECGATSIDLVRLANAMEDLGLGRPDFDELMNRMTVCEIAELCSGSAPGRQEPAAAATGDVLEERPAVMPETPGDMRAEPQRQEPRHPSVTSSHAPGGSRTTGEVPMYEVPHGVVAGSGTRGDLPGMLRELADRLEALDGELAAVRGLIREVAGEPVPGTPREATSPQVAAATTGSAAPTDESQPFPLTEMQLAYLAGRGADPEGFAVAPHYYAEAELSAFDPERLQDACDAAVAAHPMLRTVLTPDSRQVESGSASLKVEVRDHSRMTPEDQEKRRAGIRAEREARLLPFDRAPMIRILVVDLGRGRWRMHADLDLLFLDARSALQVFREIAARYRGEEITEVPTSGDFRGWVSAKESADKEEARAYWQRRIPRLPGGPVLPEPDSVGSRVFRRRRMLIRGDAWRGLLDTARAADATATCLIVDALATALGDPGPQSYLLTISDRPEGQAGVIGEYTGTMILPVDPGLPRRERLGALAADFWSGLGNATGPGGIHGNEVLRAMRNAGLRPPRVAVSSALGGVPGDASMLLEVFGETSYAISQTPNVLLDVQVFECEDVEGAVINWDFLGGAFPAGWIDGRFQEFADHLGGEVIDTPGSRAPVPRTWIPGTVNPEDAGLERRILDLLSEVLGDPAIAVPSAGSVDRAFFELGATSIHLVELHRRLVAEGLRLDVVDVFSHPSARRLATAVAASGSSCPGGVEDRATRGRGDGLDRARARGARRASVVRKRFSS